MAGPPADFIMLPGDQIRLVDVQQPGYIFTPDGGRGQVVFFRCENRTCRARIHVNGQEIVQRMVNQDAWIVGTSHPIHDPDPAYVEWQTVYAELKIGSVGQTNQSIRNMVNERIDLLSQEVREKMPTGGVESVMITCKRARDKAAALQQQQQQQQQ